MKANKKLTTELRDYLMISIAMVCYCIGWTVWRSGYFPWVRTGLYPSTVNTRNMKKETSLTPFRSALKIFIFEFNDSAEALVSLLMK